VVEEREFFIENLLARIHFIIEMIWWTGLAPWEFEFPCISTLLVARCVRTSPTRLRVMEEFICCRIVMASVTFVNPANKAELTNVSANKAER